MSTVTIHHTHDPRPPEPILRGIETLASTIFSKPLDEWDARLGHRPTILWCWALCPESNEVIGFKIGYEDRPGRFYSWLGGVHPGREGEGIARALMDAQHAWAKTNGYRVVRTHTSNQYRRMLQLNIRYGFDVIGTVHPRLGGAMRIVLEKDL